jgi:GT2 family glycosyltransferase
MDVSVIIVNYNTFSLTSQCIRSIYQYTTEVVFEIILVDNASTECDAGIFKKEFPDIIVIKNKENLGFAKANNVGIKASKGNVVLLLNSDTELKNDAISIAFNRLQSEKRNGAISVKLIFPDGSVQYQCQRFPSIGLLLAENLRLHKLLPASIRSRIFLSTYFKHESYIEPDSIWGTFFMFNKKILDEMPENKLNDEYFMYYEDKQWCVDIKKLGYKIAYEPAGIVVHYFGQSNAAKKKLMTENKELFLMKNYGSFKTSVLNALKY